jgi:uncharacterized membrane protein
MNHSRLARPVDPSGESGSSRSTVADGNFIGRGSVAPGSPTNILQDAFASGMELVWPVKFRRSGTKLQKLIKF